MCTAYICIFDFNMYVCDVKTRVEFAFEKNNARVTARLCIVDGIFFYICIVSEFIVL